MSWDAIVVGAGQNGLAAALRLARAKRRVLVVERRDEIGGLCAREAFQPGYFAPGLLHDEGLMRPEVVRRLGLDGHGLKLEPAPPALLAEEGGPGLLLHHDPGPAEPELARRSVKDAAAYRHYREFLARLAPLTGRLLTEPPPPLSPEGLGEWWAIAEQGLQLWKLGRRDTLELLRVAPMCVADFLNEQFETPLLVEALAAPAVAATWSGPWSAGTNTHLILRESAPARRVAGGPPALVAALARAAAAAGVEIRRASEVARIRVEDGRARGVVLASGETLDATAVVASCDPRRAFLELVPPGTLPLRIEEEFLRVRSRGTAAVLRLALSAPFEIAGRPGERHAEIRLGGGHVDELERAFDAIKYRQFSPRPYLDIRVPSVTDPSLAPAGGEVVTVIASFAPYGLEGGWDEARRDELAAAILARLESVAPGLGSRVVGRELLTPVDLESRYAITGGQLHHVEPALDQLFVLRPAPSAARYRTALAGLFLGGSGSHAGGGVTCTAGLLAADAVLSDAP